ncbi:hypothetical protein [Catellatospora sp. NPDC049133]|uniref:hypothetical protein n=1 Tax=Catellatospora sp. NPDC049133 TaxID=3155499 RepID=UPI0033F67A6C
MEDDRLRGFGTGAGHPRPRRGSELGHKSTVALLLVAAAGGHQVRLRDIPPRDRHYLNSKAGVLEQMGLVMCDWSDDESDTLRPAHRCAYTLTELGRTAAELIRAAATA